MSLEGRMEERDSRGKGTGGTAAEKQRSSGWEGPGLRGHTFCPRDSASMPAPFSPFGFMGVVFSVSGPITYFMAMLGKQYL